MCETETYWEYITCKVVGLVRVTDKLKVPPIALSSVKLNTYGSFVNVVSKWFT